MVDDIRLRRAVNKAGSVYRATHHGVNAADSRRCLLDRRLQGKWGLFGSDGEDLRGLGLTYLNRLPENEC